MAFASWSVLSAADAPACGSTVPISLLVGWLDDLLEPRREPRREPRPEPRPEPRLALILLPRELSGPPPTGGPEVGVSSM